MMNVGVAGLGFMGRMHFNCYSNNPDARLVAIADLVAENRKGGGSGGNLATDQAEGLDMTGVTAYTDYSELLQDDKVELVSICLPTPLHAPATMAALKAGKHVLCEKPMAFTVEQCRQMEEAQRESGKQLMIGHCLRYWPHYVKAHEIIASGKYGKVLYAHLHRTSGSPVWSWQHWLEDGSQSGGCVLDMHVHDIDTALWWFGKPQQVDAKGFVWGNMPAFVDATWHYDDGPLVSLHGAWDNNGGPFRMAFNVVMEQGTVAWDSAGSAAVQLHVGQKTEEIAVDETLGYQLEINDFVAAAAAGRKAERAPVESSRLAVELALEELGQIQA